MKPATALVAFVIFACAGSTTEPVTRLPAAGDSCAVARPAFGGAATAADRNLFAYDVDAPLNLQTTVESTVDGVEVRSISFDSPDGGSVTGLLFDPVTRSSLRPGIVLMHGMPGNARVMTAYAQALARYGAVVIAIESNTSVRVRRSARSVAEFAPRMTKPTAG